MKEMGMFSELLKFIKLGFKGRFAITYITILSLLLFGTFPNLIVRLAFFFIFLVSSALFLPLFASQFLGQVHQLLSHTKRVKLPASREIVDLAARMGVKIKKIGIVDGKTAYVIGNTIVLGKELISRLTFDERQAVVGHELAHIKKKAFLVRLGLFLPLQVIGSFSLLHLTSPIFVSESFTQTVLTIMISIGLLAYMMLVMIPINWFIEYTADETAAKYCGKENIANALLNLTDEDELDHLSETHPSTSERVKRIRNIGAKKENTHKLYSRFLSMIPGHKVKTRAT